MMVRSLLAALAIAAPVLAAPPLLPPPVLPRPVAPGAAVQPFVRFAAGAIVLRHVTLIDGSGGPVQADRTIILDGARIAAIGDAALAAPAGAVVLDLAGHSVLPGIVGMHNHLFHIARPNFETSGKVSPPVLVPQMSFSAPRLYLAAGVTTIRTAGSVEPYADLNLKTLVDTGVIPGPHMQVTGPYLEGEGGFFVQMHGLTGTDDAIRTVNFWADQGAGSIKAYMNITRAELKAVITTAHKRGLKVTGHLCAVTYAEAAALGIDNLEHGFFANTGNDPGKIADACPETAGGPTLRGMNPDSEDARALIALLVRNKVALTSTLPVFEQGVPGKVPLDHGALAAMSPPARAAYMAARDRRNSAPRERFADDTRAYANATALERRFVAAGGLLMAGPDPTGNGGVVPGFGDHRGIELLVEAGFSPAEAVRIATLNGATFLGLADRIGSVAAGKNADLIVVKGDPAHAIGDIRNVEIVFKDGVGYDPGKLLESVAGSFGQY